MKIERSLLRKIVEGALLAADEPLNVAKLAKLFELPEGSDAELDDLYEKPGNDEIRSVVEEIQADCEGRGFELKEVASGWRFQVVQDVAPWVNRIWEEKPQRYSRALLETLALIAYRQPITRGDIESIRGVAVSSNIIKTLTEREWVKVVGHRDVPGRPALYATTRQFLDYFNLKSLDELPSLKEIQDFDKLDAELDLASAMGEAVATGEPDTENETAPEPEQEVEATAGESPAATDVQADDEGEVAEDALALDEPFETLQTDSEEVSSEATDPSEDEDSTLASTLEQEEL